MVEEAENIDTMGGEEMAGGEGLGNSFLHQSDVLDHQGLYSGVACIPLFRECWRDTCNKKITM